MRWRAPLVHSLTELSCWRAFVHDTMRTCGQTHKARWPHSAERASVKTASTQSANQSRTLCVWSAMGGSMTVPWHGLNVKAWLLTIGALLVTFLWICYRCANNDWAILCVDAGLIPSVRRACLPNRRIQALRLKMHGYVSCTTPFC